MEIEFEGSYDLKTIRNKTALAEQPSQKFLIRQLLLALFPVSLLAVVVLNIYQSKQYFSRNSLFVVFLLFIIYYILQPYIAPYLAVIQASMVPIKPPVHRGTVSSEGIKYLSDSDVEIISWKAIYKAKQTDDLIVLFADYSPSLAFPRKFFKDEADWQQFRRWVDFYVKKI
jgi:hypothetical protein